MRIDGSDPLSHIARLYAKSREVQRDSAVTEPGDKDDLSQSTERAQISEEARLLSLAREAFDRLPGVRGQGDTSSGRSSQGTASTQRSSHRSC